MHFVRFAVRGGRRQKMIKKCKNCRKDFKALRGQRYCCDECRENFHKPTKRETQIPDINEQARLRRLTYGQYQAQRYMRARV